MNYLGYPGQAPERQERDFTFDFLRGLIVRTAGSELKKPSVQQ
jgi:hypothetical protein